jgi:hypothetical protein
MSQWSDTGERAYEVQQIDNDGELLSAVRVDAVSSDVAVRQLDSVVEGTDRIVVCLDGDAMNEMSVGYWKKRVRRR